MLQLWGAVTVNVIAWNIAQRAAAWSLLVDSDVDIGLIQEARKPPRALLEKINIDSAPWQTGQNRGWRAAVAKLSDRVDVQWLDAKRLADEHGGELAVSRPGTLAAAIVTPASGEPFIVVSLYAPWETPHRLTKAAFIYADASVHRLISDISVLVGKRARYEMLVAGDLNILHGHGEHGDAYWASRYETVFSRMRSIGFSFVGPQAPHGRQAEPWPDELPRTSKNVPTYYAKGEMPATCTRQLDFVFASHGLVDRVRVRALNEPNEWGPSDHCRVEIRVE